MMKNKRRVSCNFHLTVTRGSNQCNKSRKRNKIYMVLKGRNKTAPVHRWHSCLCKIFEDSGKQTKTS